MYYELKKQGHNIKKVSNDQTMKNVVDDLFFFSSSKNMKIIIDLYDNIYNYFNAGIQFSNHYLLHHHLKSRGKIKDIELSIERIFEIDLTRRFLGGRSN